jgi:hypothetical protein
MRSQLRSLYIEKRWESLLEATEQIMGSRVGRGWLDLQFYAVHACEALGDPYDDVRSAIIGGLRALLADLPSLASSTLMDAMPTATPETMRGSRITSFRSSDAPSNSDARFVAS